MNQKKLEAFAKEAEKNIKTGADLDKFRAMLTKVTVEAALNAELDEHLVILNMKKQMSRIIVTALAQRKLLFYILLRMKM